MEASGGASGGHSDATDEIPSRTHRASDSDELRDFSLCFEGLGTVARRHP